MGGALGGALHDDARIYWVWSEHVARGQVIGTHPFFLAPLYPYILGLLRALGIETPTGVLLVQALWGAGAVVLLADAARQLTCRTIGAAVGVSLCFYETAVFFDGLVLSESLLFFLEAVLLWWVSRTNWTGARWSSFGVVGLLIGLLAAGRATAAVLLVPALVLLLTQAALATRLPRLTSLAAGFSLVVLPIALHNYAVGREWIPFTYNGGLNFYVGYNPRATGAYVHITDPNEGQPLGLDGGVELDGREYLKRTEGVSLSPAASSAHWASKARGYVAQDPQRALWLAGRKLAMLWSHEEYPQIESIEEYRTLAGPVGLPVVGSFGVLGTLAIAGAWGAWNRGAVTRFVFGYAVMLTLSSVPFFVADRYRHHLVPACALLAALALGSLWTAWRSRNPGLRARAVVALSIGLAITWFPLSGPTEAQRAAHLAKNLGVRWLASGRPQEAVSAFQKALDAAGTEDARSQHGTGSVLPPRELADLHFRFGLSLMQLGRAAEAERHFLEAVRQHPTLSPAWTSLIRVQVQTGAVDKARETLSLARAAALPLPAYRVYEALFAALSGDTARARLALVEVPPNALIEDPSLADVVRVTRQLLSQR